jgi:hypothetical protein
VAASLSRDQVREFDLALSALLRARFPHDPLVVPHRLFALVAARGGGALPFRA